jgi:hypothetical protein
VPTDAEATVTYANCSEAQHHTAHEDAEGQIKDGSCARAAN